MDAVLDVDAGGQRQHRRLAAAVAQPMQDVEARHAGQPDVQDDQIEGPRHGRDGAAGGRWRRPDPRRLRLPGCAWARL
ncbi:hypothetical protein G6F24_018487 [Rhizopus arrhizus]|nr:hypothetical protein G6F24_018487 [Rhizopus arrhizus]